MTIAVRDSGMPRKEMLLYVRNFMEEIPGNREFDCEFMPTDADGAFYPMAGLYPARTEMHRRAFRLGYREVRTDGHRGQESGHQNNGTGHLRIGLRR